MKELIAGAVLGLLAARSLAADSPPATPVTIALGERQALATPSRLGFARTGGGNIDVSQPSADVLVLSMAGVAVAGAHPVSSSQGSITFELTQRFEVVVADPKMKRARITLEGNLTGFLRSQANSGGSAEIGPACASLHCANAHVQGLCLPSHAVSCGNALAVNDHQGPLAYFVNPGVYNLYLTFRVTASNPPSVVPYKACSAEFAPDPALDPLWISSWEPFHGANKKNLGFQVVVKVGPDDSEPSPPNLPAPQPEPKPLPAAPK